MDREWWGSFVREQWKIIVGVLVLLCALGVGIYFTMPDEDALNTSGMFVNEAGELVEYQSLPASGNTIEADYECSEGKLFETSYDLGSNELTVMLPDGVQHNLPQAPTSKGARYATLDGSIIFLESGGKASLEMNGKTEYSNCVAEL